MCIRDRPISVRGNAARVGRSVLTMGLSVRSGRFDRTGGGAAGWGRAPCRGVRVPRAGLQAPSVYDPAGMASSILIVEDEHAVARGIQYALQQEGYEVLRRIRAAEGK